MSRHFSLLKSPKILIIGGLTAYLVYAVVTANPPGYCAAQKRVIPDEEFIQIAIKDISWRMDLDGSESSIKSYYENHPWCCAVLRGPTFPSWQHNFFEYPFDRYSEVTVQLIIEQNRKGTEYEGGSKYYEALSPYDLCGENKRKQGFEIGLSDKEYQIRVESYRNHSQGEKHGY